MNREDIFNKGDFITKVNYDNGCFMIYEGEDYPSNSSLYYKPKTLICRYDPYNSEPLKTGDQYKPCPIGIDTDRPNYYYRKCNAEEVEKAIEVLRKHGYMWDEENLSLISVADNSVVRRIHLPDDTYHGQIITSVSDDMREILLQYAVNATKTTSYPYGTSYSKYWSEYYDDD